MFRPDLYQQSNSVTRKDTTESLEKYAKELMKLRQGSCIMDLGCGDGSVTSVVLKQFLPQDYKMIVGTDIGEPMVEYANKEFGDDKTSFKVWDMCSKVPSDFVESFDLVFSSYAVHWVQDQENVFSNVFKMLKENGECLLVFIGSTTIYDVYRVLAKKPRWSQLLRNTEFYISPYQDSLDPAKQVRRIMATAGFNKINVQCEEKTYLYEENHFKRTMESICPFKIPAEQQEEYMSDFMEAVRDVMTVKEIEGKSIVKVKYTLLVVNGAKPS